MFGMIIDAGPKCYGSTIPIPILADHNKGQEED